MKLISNENILNRNEHFSRLNVGLWNRIGTSGSDYLSWIFMIHTTVRVFVEEYCLIAVQVLATRWHCLKLKRARAFIYKCA